MSVRSLDAWLYGDLVAHIRNDSQGRVRLEFTADALHRWGHGSAVVSGLLPLSERAPAPALARAWLLGLLPEGRTRARLAERAGVDPDDPVAFLSIYGRDTAGALILVPTGENPDADTSVPRAVDDDEIGAMLDEAAVQGAADQLTSLGGLETKIVLTATDRGFARPTAQAPSTHILKLSRPTESLAADLIDTENASLDLARRIGVSTVDAHLRTFAGRRTIVVRRYDRAPRPDGTVARIHQEDTAQLLGLDTRDPARKFQYGKALPSLAAIAARLDRMGVDTAELLAQTTFALAVGDTDAHAKNISVVHDADGTHRLAPAYDIAMHTHHTHAERRFAMDVVGERDTARLSSGDLLRESGTWGVPPRRAARVVESTLVGLRDALGAIDRDAHPGVGSLAWETVHGRVDRLLDGLPRAVPSASRPAAPPQDRAPRGTPHGGRFLPRT